MTLPPASVIFCTAAADLLGSLTVAMTLCPAFRARRAKRRPMPLEVPLMNQTGEDMMKGFDWRFDVFLLAQFELASICFEETDAVYKSGAAILLAA